MNLFQNRSLLIATQHGKETVMAPLLEAALGVRCITSQGFDTDTLGTFTGEVERRLDPYATAKEKCLQAMERMGCDLAVSSEGSFGPHPALFFVPSGDELVVLIDKRHGLEVFGRELTTATNFAGSAVHTERELLAFAEKAGFPQHALILRPAAAAPTGIIKGITEQAALLQAFRQLLGQHGSVYVETDMRAMHNPTRMAAIGKATEKLIGKLLHHCPNCAMPGMDVAEAIAGLPCNLCGLPTKSTLAYIYRCKHCTFAEEVRFPLGKQTEEPRFCDYCNP
jgi:hypothetical protein